VYFGNLIVYLVLLLPHAEQNLVSLGLSVNGDSAVGYAILVVLIVALALAALFFGLRQKERKINKILQSRNRELAEQKKEQDSMLKVVEALNSQLQAQNNTMKHVAIVSITDLDGRIVNVNENFLIASGYERDEVLGKRHDFLISGSHSKEFYRELWQTLKSGNTWRGEICNRNKEGGLYWSDTAIAPILDENEKPKQYFSLQFEITKRKRYEEQLKAQKEQMAEMNSLKDKLFSIVSHDFRSPLNSLRGTLSLYLHGLLSQEDMNQIGSSLLNKLDTTSNMLDNLLHWARNQMEGMKVQPSRINLYELVQENIDLIKMPAEKKGVRIIGHVEDPTWVSGDIEMVKLVVRNLLSNALKFSKVGGEISITSTKDQGKIITCVKDQGIGIETEKIKKLFSLETQPSKGTSDEIGIGLGLSLCKDFVERNKGEIWVESKINEGSAFYFSLNQS
jgi:PAS domain S-box-containing protein